MKRLLIITAIAVWLGAYAYAVKAKTVATQPNKAGGKIVLTDEACTPSARERYDTLRRAYNYSSSGGTSEGCWTIEDETVVVIWINPDDTRSKSRYPIYNFTLSPNNSGGASNGYKY